MCNSRGLNCDFKLRASDGAVLGTYNVGTGYIGQGGELCSDGSYIWVTNSVDDTVTKLRASDGAIFCVYSVGDAPRDICFDGANVWVTSPNDNTVSKLYGSYTGQTSCDS